MANQILALGMLCATLVFVASAPPAAAQAKGPLANAGLDQQATEGMKVILRGSGRDPTGARVVRFAWSQVSGPRVALRNANRSTAHFVAPRAKEKIALTFRLTVVNSRGAKGVDFMTVTINPKNTSTKPPPVIDEPEPQPNR